MLSKISNTPKISKTMQFVLKWLDVIKQYHLPLPLGFQAWFNQCFRLGCWWLGFVTSDELGGGGE